MSLDANSHGLWGASAPPAPPTDALLGPAETDVAVIGAGYTGLSTALHLAEAGVAVTVLEAEAIGFGGAGRNVGLVNAGMWVKPEALLATLGPDYGDRLLRFLGGAPQVVFDLVARHGIACEAVHAGTLHCAVGAEGLADVEDRARQWRAYQAPVELLDAEETRWRIGGGRYAGALLDRRAGTIQPLAYARGLAGAALRAGARIHTGSPVGGVERAGAGWRLTTPTGALLARRVVAAGDAYASRVFPELRGQQVHLPYFNFATAPLPAVLRAGILAGGEGCWDTREVLSSFRLDAAGRLVFGSVGALEAPDAAVHRAWAERAMTRVFPQLAGIPFESAWYGKIGMTADNLPRLHVLGEGILAVAGYNGRGIAPGTVFGRALAEHLLGERPLEAMPLPVAKAEAAPLRAVKEAGYRVGAGLVHLVSDRF